MNHLPYIILLSLFPFLFSCHNDSTLSDDASRKDAKGFAESIKLANKRFISRSGKILGNDTDTEISFNDKNKVTLIEYGLGVKRWHGDYKIRFRDGSYVVWLDFEGKKWPEMVLTDDDGSFILSRRDGITRMMPDVQDVNEFENYWPFREVIEPQNHKPTK